MPLLDLVDCDVPPVFGNLVYDLQHAGLSLPRSDVPLHANERIAAPACGTGHPPPIDHQSGAKGLWIVTSCQPKHHHVTDEGDGRRCESAPRSVLQGAMEGVDE